jgi:hypothetical protein
MVGSGAEDPSIVSELLDVNRHPRKPQYRMASELPLLLNLTGFADLGDLHFSPEAASNVRKRLDQLTADHEIRLGMLYTVGEAVEVLTARQQSSSGAGACERSCQLVERCLTPAEAGPEISVHGLASEQHNCLAATQSNVVEALTMQSMQHVLPKMHSPNEKVETHAACSAALSTMPTDNPAAPKAQSREPDLCSGPASLTSHGPVQPISKKLRRKLGPRVLGRPHIKLLQRATELSFSERLAAIQARGGSAKLSHGPNLWEDNE